MKVQITRVMAVAVFFVLAYSVVQAACDDKCKNTTKVRYCKDGKTFTYGEHMYLDCNPCSNTKQTDCDGTVNKTCSPYTEVGKIQMHRTATGTPTCACGVGIMRTEAATVTSTDEWLPFDWNTCGGVQPSTSIEAIITFR